MGSFFSSSKPTSYIAYTFSDKSFLQITVPTEKKRATTRHRAIGNDVATKKLVFNLSIDKFRFLIKKLGEDEKSWIAFEEGDKDLLIKSARTSHYDGGIGTWTSQGYYFKAKDHNTLMAFVTKLKKANSQFDKHLSDELLKKVEQLEEHYPDEKTLRDDFLNILEKRDRDLQDRYEHQCIFC